MATTLGELAVLLTANNAKFNRDIKDSESNLGKFEASAQKAAKAAGVVFAGGAIVSGLLIDAASDAAEQMNVLDIAFGDNTASVVQWSAETSKAVGRSATDLKDYAGQIGALVSPTLGVSKATTEMSTDLATLAIDLGSVFNVAEEETLGALRSALIGSSEPMQRFGVNLNVAALQAFALEKGISKTVLKMTEAEKITLRYAFIMEKTAKFQGDAERTAAGWANMTKRVGGQVTDLSARIGAGLLPHAEKLIAVVSDAIGWFQGLSDETLGYIGVTVGVVTAIAGVATAAGALGAVLPALIAGFVVASTAAFPVILAIGIIALKIGILITAVALVRKVWVDNIGGIQEKAASLLSFFSGVWTDSINTLSAQWFDFTNDWADAWQDLMGFLTSSFSSVFKFISKTFDKIGPVALEALRAINPAMAVLVDGMKLVGGSADFVGEKWERLQFIAKATGERWGRDVQKIKDVVSDTMDTVVQEAGFAWEGIKGAAGETASFVSDAFTELGADLAKMFGITGDDFDALMERVNKTAPAPRAAGVGGAVVIGKGEGVAAATSDAAVISAAGDIAGKFGELGGLVQTGLEGFISGGPLTAITSVFADLAMSTEAFGTLIADIGDTFEVLVDALEPLIEVVAEVVSTILTALEPVLKVIGDIILNLVKGGLGDLLIAFGSLVTAILPIVEVLLIALGPIFDVLAFVMRGFAIVVGAVALAIGWVVNAVIDVVTGILDIIADIAGVFGGGSGIQEFSNSLKEARVDVDGLADSLKATVEGTNTFGAADEISEGGLDADLALRQAEQQGKLAIAQFTLDLEGVGEAMAEMLAIGAEQIQRDVVDPLEDLGTAAQETADSFREINEALSNIPQGFKVAAARFGAIDVDGGAGLDQETAGGNTFIIQANDALDVWAKLKEFDRADKVLGGLSPATATPNAVDRQGS